MTFSEDKEDKKPKLINRQFFNVGCKRIIPELFCPPISNQGVSPYERFSSFKPAGGFWTTEDDGYANSNDWLMYMAERADNGDDDLMLEKFSPDTVTVTLKEGARILQPKTIIELLILKEMYPIIIDRKHSINNLIDYTKLSQKYDGIFISKSLINSSLLHDWCVPTLVLFNENVIDSYKNKTIEKYFDGCWLFIETEIDPEVRKIPTISSDYLEVFEKFNELYLRVLKNELNNISCDHYAEFIEILSHTYDKFIKDNKELFSHLTNVIIPNALNIEKTLTPIEKSKYSEHAYYSLDCKLRTQNDEYLKDIYKRSLKK